jgi:hypothetical protein
MQAKTVANTGSLRVTETADTAAVTGATFSVSAIAEALIEIEPNSAALIERIRGWTKQRILFAVGNVGAGVGKHIRYDATSVPYECALLNALANAGIPVSGRPYVQFTLARLREVLPKWQQRLRNPKSPPPLFLVIKRLMSGRADTSEPSVDIVNRVNIDQTAESMHIVNLGVLFSRIRRPA